MKLNFDVNIVQLAVVFFVGGVVGMLFSPSVVGFLEPTSEPLEVDCLSSVDLNRSDLASVIVFSRFCEGLGLQSSVYWQQDSDGKTYGLPVCIQLQEVQQ